LHVLRLIPRSGTQPRSARPLPVRPANSVFPDPGQKRRKGTLKRETASPYREIKLA